MAELTERQKQVYDAILAEPGLRPSTYAEALGMAPVAVGNTARQLYARGLIRVEGTTKDRTYAPARVRRVAKRPLGQRLERVARQSAPPAEPIKVSRATLIGETLLVVDGTVYLVTLEPIT